MEQRNVIGFNFVRRQSETSLHCLKQDQNANIKNNIQRPIQRSSTFTPRDISRVTGVTARITLPERFKRRIRRKNSTSHLNSPVVANGLSNIDEEIDPDKDIDWEDRKGDMDRAIEWVKQELLHLREQDRVLVKRFLDLQTAIQHKHGIRSCPSLVARSSSSLSSASWLSLDDGSLSAPGDTPVHQRDILLELQQRAQVNYAHLIMRQSSADISTKIRSLEDLQTRTVSLMNMSLRDVESGDESDYDTLKKYKNNEVLTESEDESNYDTLTKYPSKKKEHTSLHHEDTLTNTRINDTESDNDSNYDTLTKYPRDDDSEYDSEENYNTLTKHPNPHIKYDLNEDILSSQFDKEIENTSDFDTDSLEIYIDSDEKCEDSSFDTHL